MSTEDGATIEDIQETKITEEHGEMYVFQWIASTEKKIAEASPSTLKAKQADIEATLVKIITAPNPFPVPGRAIRNVVARCLVSLYTRSETRTLFDTIQAFLKIVGDSKTADRDPHRIAALYCVGEVMFAFGSQFMSFMAEIATVTLRLSKSSSNSPLLRYHAILALRKSLSSAKRAVADNTVKDIIKQMRSALTDKCHPVQRASAEVLIVMYSGDNHPSTSDIDSIITLSVRSLEHADHVTRRSLSQLVGHLLASTQTPRAVPSSEPPIKKSGAELLDTDSTTAGHAAASEVTKPLLTPTEMLLHLSTQYNKPNLSRKCRIVLFDFYAALFIKLGGAFTETNYSLIVSHLMTEIVSSLRSGSSRYEVLLVRRLVEILLRDLIGVRMLSEQGQIGAIQELASSYLKRWPALMPGQTAPSSTVLAIVLREVAGLLQQLGNAPPPVQDAVAEPLVTLLAHPSYTIRVNASWTLRCFCSSTPLRLPKTIITVFELLQRDMITILSPAAPSDINLRSLGHAYGLSALVSIIPERPLYVSYDVSAKVLDMAIQLLKHSAEHDVKIAGIEVEVAWTLIASLMSLGPNFVRAHLQQLLVLWRNALPKPTSKDVVDNTTRPLEEWMFLFHLRESALSAILSFLKHNSTTLVTLDVGRRIAMVLSNALLFANNFINQKVDDGTDTQIPGPQPKGLTLKEREALLRRRVYECFTVLGFSNIPEATQTTLLQSAVMLFASADGYAGSSVQAAIASSSGTFTSVWNSVDGYAYGVTFTEIVDHGDLGAHSDSSTEGKDQLNRDSIEASIDSLLRKPIFGAREHDKLTLCRTRIAGEAEQEPPPPATAIVDAAIDLFSRLLPLQDTASTTRAITQLLEAVRSPRLEKNTGRKAAVTVNATIALALALRNATTSHYRQARDTLGSGQVTTLLSPFLKDTLVDGDYVLRSATSECIGRLASLGGTNFLTNQIKQLVDQVVSNRDPHARAGCALTFGAVYTHVGGLAAGPLLKTTVNVLMSLSNDPHPLVHFWALNALARVINAASLAYAPFVSSTLGMLLKIYLMDSHECEGSSLPNANLSGDYPAYPVVCQIIDAVITVLGPDIQESSKTRTLVLNLVHEFSLEVDEGIRVEAIKCFQHFLMFAPEHVDIPDLVNHFRGYLSSTCRPLKVASINALYQLVQKDALAMSKLGGDQLVENLFSMLDDDASVEGVRSVITSWLHQTVVYNPSAWIDLCQRIMSRTTASQQVADAATRQNMRDDEGESLSVGITQDGGDGVHAHLTSRWRTQLFALQCLHQICSIVAESGRKEHVDVIFARAQGIPTSGLLISRVTDLIKMAFTASTAYVTELRMEGLVVLRDVIQIFATSPDPAFEDSLLLEQHQAPITAALTPAFSADSTPEILASAVQACAVFVGCGVVKDVNRMGRILKLLTTALEQSKDSGMVKLGETAELSPNASAMLRISTVSAWAGLEVSSTRQSYLKNVVDPYRASLATLWVVSLRDYASIRIDSEFLHDTSVALDSTYSSLGKEVLLPYYAQSWSLILQAVATAMQANDPHILTAMHGGEGGDAGLATVNGNGHEEPSAMFFVIFGLAYEALVSSADSNSMSSTQQSTVLSALMALKCLVLPQYAGKAIMESTIFDEFIAVCYRMAMTETAYIQTHLVEVLSVLALSQKAPADSSLDTLSANSPKAHCLRTCAYILRHTTSASQGPIIQGDVADRIKMITACFSAFGNIAASLNTSQREDIRGVAILLYSEMLKDESSEIDFVGPTLPCLKALLDLPISTARDSRDRYCRLGHGLISACLLNIDGVRGRQGFISTKKVKNNLLATVLILTVMPPTVKVGRAVLEHACFLISQKLLDADEASLTAAHCAKTLMIASTSGNPVLCQCAKLLVPSLIEYIAKMAPFASDGSITESHAAAIGEVWKAFSSFFASVAEEHRSRLLGVILPTITLLLTNTEVPPSSVVTQSIAQLLSYATSSPAAFKEAAGKLEPSSRELLEQSVRRAIGGNASSASGANAAKPQISLRSF
ncbi:clathrin-coated vesicle protein [Desarmillaria ectypa]|nr:clathrin-coated vesicle protein [Desarmillaria ectypa]